jgi:sugar lactone lactonase YvrE
MKALETSKRLHHHPHKKNYNNLVVILRWILIVSLAQGIAGSAARTSQASLVQIIDVSQFSPPSPDPAGIAYLDFINTFIVSDSEVNEMTFFTGGNLFEMTPDGFLVNTFTTISFSNEPTGVAFNPINRHLFFSDDDMGEIFEVDPGLDGLYGTTDDIVTSFDTAAFNSTDPEGITFDTRDEVLFVVDGKGSKVYRIDPGADRIFNGVPAVGDDEVASFDVLSLGVRDPEGIAFNTDNGNLFIIGEPIYQVAEVTTAGNLVRMIDITDASAHRPAGLAYAPSSVNPAEMNLFIADRGIGNESNPNENDGVIFEVTIPLCIERHCAGLGRTYGGHWLSN